MEKKGSFLAGTGRERERRGRGSTFSLRSTEFDRSFSNGPRFKVGVLDESHMCIPETPSFAKVHAKGSGSQKASGSGSVRGTFSRNFSCVKR